MANICSNNLKVSATNNSPEAKAQLVKFVEDINEKGVSLTKEEAKLYKENYLQENFEARYSNDVPSFVEHSEMSIKDFMTQVAYFQYNKDKKVFTEGGNVFSIGRIYDAPKELFDERLNSFGGPNGKIADILRAEMKKKYGYDSVSSWRSSNWGTRSVYDTSLGEKDGVMNYVFNSPWSPPVEFFKHICEQYPLLDFTLNFEEPGMGFEGDLKIEAGSVVEEEDRDYVPKHCCECGEHIDDLGEALNADERCTECQAELDAEDNEED